MCLVGDKVGLVLKGLVFMGCYYSIFYYFSMVLLFIDVYQFVRVKMHSIKGNYQFAIF